MRKMLAIIAVLVCILLGMIIYKKYTIHSKSISMQEIKQIEENINKIYMWKEITDQAIPTFEDINQANEKWIWEVIKKNLDDYQSTSEKIQEVGKEIFGEKFTKKLPQEGNETFKYDDKTTLYIATETNLDEKEDTFLLEKIERNHIGYEIEIIEYIEDYSNSEQIIIRNLNNDEIGQVKSDEPEEKIQEIVKNNKEKFSNKKIILNKKFQIQQVKE